MKLGAIDIGSNAARLLIADIHAGKKGETEFNKINLIRVPLRLGMDVFTQQRISDKRKSMILESMQAFRHLLNAYAVDRFRACATSAMRDAQNSKEIIEEVKAKTGIPIEIISGDEEASLVFENRFMELLDKNKDYLYIDVGGGSTEISFLTDGKLGYRHSFNIGTIRLLQGLVKEEDWSFMKSEIKSHIHSGHSLAAIGSGGNINKVFSLSKKKENAPLSLSLLKSYYRKLEYLTVEERIRLYNLREDRADVIVPALKIFINVLHWAGISEIYVPKIGLADGLVYKLYREIKQTPQAATL